MLCSKVVTKEVGTFALDVARLAMEVTNGGGGGSLNADVGSRPGAVVALQVYGACANTLAITGLATTIQGQDEHSHRN
jgi:hypothetical protein